MIKINFKFDNSYITYFKVSGHANYDIYSKDIVCASVSSIVITSINLALKLDNNSLKVKQEEGLIDAEVLVKSDVINKVLLNMKDMLEELSNNYKKYVKII